jgi:UDP-glucuronate 4-epimerase
VGEELFVILVTGAAGFIGFHVCQRLLRDGEQVLGIDNLNAYYDVRLKLDRLAQLEGDPGFTFQRIDIADRAALPSLFGEFDIERVVHLAAQAGVRYSIENPHAFVDANLVGFVTVLEACRNAKVQHLVFASSSSVYGNNAKVPFSTGDNVDHPISLYAATKKANELIAFTYSHLFELPSTGLRFFTVYGPWGRPDMAYFAFTKAILAGEPITLFNDGQSQRDFTYIDDIAEGVVRVLRLPPDTSGYVPPYRVFNIGNNEPVALLRFVEVLEQCIGLEATWELVGAQPGDVERTFADIQPIFDAVGFRPMTAIEEGLARFVDWYLEYKEAREGRHIAASASGVVHGHR